MPKKRAAPDEANSENVHESVHKVPIADDETLRDDGFVVQRGVVMYDYPTIGDYYSSGVVSVSVVVVLLRWTCRCGETGEGGE